ncbi:D-alanyl-D-alanine carboxypeptidase/D-alanyl-D-alanine-endopeptidase [bacterium]|nr:D-alanyl-D-alanine carboxypeptidase/D-alanyl-D-alanine-endopeptidase [candidate division CSSED10-310 bacterium]
MTIYRRFLCLHVICILLIGLPVTADENSVLNADDHLHRAITAVLGHRVCREGQVGIYVSELSTGRSVFEHNPDLPLKPASNQKILTTIGALGLLSPEYAFSTHVMRDESGTQAIVEGNLYIIGGGDPFLVKEQLWILANQVYTAGIREVKGDIVADGSIFDDNGIPSPDWQRIKMPLWYNAPTGGLAFNFNAVSVVATPGSLPGQPVTIIADPALEYFQVSGEPTTGEKGSKITLILDIKEQDGFCSLVVKGRMPAGCETQSYYRHVSDSARYAGYAFKHYLEQNGVIVRGTVQPGKTPDSAGEVTLYQSDPLFILLQKANKFSNNFMMEQAVKTIAAEVHGKPGTTRQGLDAILGYLQKTGCVSTEGMVMSDGSGLSMNNRISARQFVDIMRYAVNESSFGPEFVTMLPVAGVDGTLRRRLKDHPEKRLVRGKTGLIDNVVCLTGLVDGRGGKGLAFSILINNNRSRHRDSKQIQDQIIEALLDYWKAIGKNGPTESGHPES